MIEKLKELDMTLAKYLLTGDEKKAFAKSEEIINLIGLERFYVETITKIMEKRNIILLSRMLYSRKRNRRFQN